jgi:D-tyrosyl-tRNA(Tyr) deacylase
MRAVVQRVASASVCVVDGGTPRETGRIASGLVVLVGVERGDSLEDARYVAAKIRELRVFRDEASQDRMNLSVADAGGAVLLISQFTLAGDCRTGRRPSFDDAAPADLARPLYEAVVSDLKASGLSVATGEFQATMHVALVNDGPVTLLLDSRKRF